MAALTQIEPARPGGENATDSVGERLIRLQRAQIAWGARAIVLVDGWDASGRAALLRQLAAVWDPCHFVAHCLPLDNGRHWLAPYWERLPSAGHTALFRGSWYGAVARDRALGRIDDRLWARRCDEINEFEAQQGDHGTVLVKAFLDIAPSVQEQRLAARAADPWRGAGSVEEPARDALQKAWSDIFARTDTRWAPWLLIDANEEDAAGRLLMVDVADALQRRLPAQPPARDSV